MTQIEAMLELIIFARERGGDDEPEIRQAIRMLELKIQVLNQARRRRQLRRCKPCEMCNRLTPAGILCPACLERAPQRIRNAFSKADGLDGIRDASRMVRDYALGIHRREAA